VVAIAIGFMVDMGEPWNILIPVIGIIVVPYTWWAVTIGALGSYLMRRGEAKQAAQNAPPK
jgi:hypothetical protein